MGDLQHEIDEAAVEARVAEATTSRLEMAVRLDPNPRIVDGFRVPTHEYVDPETHCRVHGQPNPSEDKYGKC